MKETIFTLHNKTYSLGLFNDAFCQSPMEDDNVGEFILFYEDKEVGNKHNFNSFTDFFTNLIETYHNPFSSSPFLNFDESTDDELYQILVDSDYIHIFALEKKDSLLFHLPFIQRKTEII